MAVQDVFHPSYRYLVEMIGTFLLGIGTLIAHTQSGSPIVTSIVCGFLRSALMYTTGPISGGHMSPVLSVATHLRRSRYLSLKNLLGYLAAQALGSLGSVVVVSWLQGGRDFLPSIPIGNLPEITQSRALQLELGFSASIALVYLHTYTSSNANAHLFFALATGFMTAGATVAAVGISGAFFDPFLATITILFRHHGKEHLWLYWVGPLVGALLAPAFFLLMAPAEFIVVDRKGRPTGHPWLLYLHSIRVWKGFAEMVATMILTMTAITGGFGGGFALLGLIYMANHLTMAQFNPAVTVSFFLHGAVKSKKSLFQYLLAELLGGAIGGLLGKELIIKENKLNIPHVGKAWLCEFLFTFALLFVCHASTPGRFTKDHGGIGIALLIIAASFAVGSHSGGIFNPAVALGVCIASGAMRHYWIYLTACTLGGVLSFIIQAAYNKTNLAFRDKMRRKAELARLQAEKSSMVGIGLGHLAEDDVEAGGGAGPRDGPSGGGHLSVNGGGGGGPLMMRQDSGVEESPAEGYKAPLLSSQ